MKKDKLLYTTVTVSDFKNKEYIDKLIKLNIGIEIALLTQLPNLLQSNQIEKDLDNLKKEIICLKEFFDNHYISLNKVRIHQPAGYSYYWFDYNKTSGFDLLKEFFFYCCNLGFKHYIIHAPIGNIEAESKKEIENYRKKLRELVPEANLEVEEIFVSQKEIHNQKNRYYTGALFEDLMKDQKASILLDIYECDGIERFIQRMNYLISKGFEIKSIHLHKNKHKFLTCKEFEFLLTSGFCGNYVNEGFIKQESSFDEFIKTKSTNCIIPNNKRIDILKKYLELIIK